MEDNLAVVLRLSVFIWEKCVNLVVLYIIVGGITLLSLTPYR